MTEIRCNYVFKRSQTLYGCSDVERLLAELEGLGYTTIPFSPPSLGFGSILLVPRDTENYYCYVIEEVFLNQWCSGHKVRRVQYHRIGKRIWKMAEQYENNEEV